MSDNPIREQAGSLAVKLMRGLGLEPDPWQREVLEGGSPRLRQTSESWFRQEYGCSFEALEGLVYPDLARCVVPSLSLPGWKRDQG